MNIVITMAGNGNRFRQAGFLMPKYMIVAHGKTLFEWSLESLKDYARHASRYIFIVQKKDHAVEFIGQTCIRFGINNPIIHELDEMTDGQATTCYMALSNCAPQDSLLVYNIDTYIESGALKYADLAGAGCIPCFRATGDHWSFVRTDQNGRVVEVKEKIRISDLCSLGAYYFSSVALYNELYNECYKSKDKKTTSEKYIAPMYNILIAKGEYITAPIVEKENVHVLGTPQELEVFLTNF